MNNINNKLLRKDQLEDLISSYTGFRVQINNLRRFQTAFAHKSFKLVNFNNTEADNYCVIAQDVVPPEDNERLEFIGDRVLELAVAEYLYDRFPDKDEGFITTLKIKMVKKETLATLGQKMGIKDLMLLSCHIDRNDGRNNIRYYEDIFEAIVGCLYLDQNRNFPICKAFVLGVFLKFIDLDKLQETDTNFKSKLMNVFHDRKWGDGSYVCINESNVNGNTFNKEFTMVVPVKKGVIDEKNWTGVPKIHKEISKQIKNLGYEFDTKTFRVLGIGKGKTKKQAEQEAAKSVLTNLGVDLKI